MVVCHPLLEAEFWGIALIEIAHVFQYILQHRYRNSWNKNTYLLTKEWSRNMYNKMIISFSLLGYIWTGYCLNVSEAPNTTCCVALQDMSLGGYSQYSLMILQRLTKTGQELRINHKWKIDPSKKPKGYWFIKCIHLSQQCQQDLNRNISTVSQFLHLHFVQGVWAFWRQPWHSIEHNSNMTWRYSNMTWRCLACINPYCLWLKQMLNMNVIEMNIYCTCLCQWWYSPTWPFCSYTTSVYKTEPCCYLQELRTHNASGGPKPLSSLMGFPS